ncbi:MAG: CaiB/BaiF CoA transferase family protein, partial [Planctomycetota bacterium]
SRILAGPTCTMMLGDLGAEVIKVERPGTGDDTRTWGPPFAGSESAYYLSCNRNKKSITIDLQHPVGVDLIKELTVKSDVLVENFKPGLTNRFGIDYETLKKVNPKLIYCSITAYGQDGPYRDRPGYDMVLSAAGGLMWITGEQDGNPCKVGVAITDVLTGVNAMGAILASLLWRERSGRGQFIDCSLLDIQVSGLANIASNYLVAGQEAKRWGTAHESIAPYQVFKTKDHPLAIAAANQKLWENFARALDRDEWLQDPRFTTNPLRVKNRSNLIPLIAKRMLEKTCDEWMEILVKAAVPCGPVNNMERLFADPQVIHRDMKVQAPHPTIGMLNLCGIPVKYSDTPGVIHTPPPLLGQHTEEILTHLLELDAGRIKFLRENRVI